MASLHHEWLNQTHSYKESTAFMAILLSFKNWILSNKDFSCAWPDLPFLRLDLVCNSLCKYLRGTAERLRRFGALVRTSPVGDGLVAWREVVEGKIGRTSCPLIAHVQANRSYRTHPDLAAVLRYIYGTSSPLTGPIKGSCSQPAGHRG